MGDMKVNPIPVLCWGCNRVTIYRREDGVMVEADGTPHTCKR